MAYNNNGGSASDGFHNSNHNQQIPRQQQQQSNSSNYAGFNSNIKMEGDVLMASQQTATTQQQHQQLQQQQHQQLPPLSSSSSSNTSATLPALPVFSTPRSVSNKTAARKGSTKKASSSASGSTKTPSGGNRNKKTGRADDGKQHSSKSNSSSSNNNNKQLQSFDITADATAALPLSLVVYAFHPATQKFHECRILERQQRDSSSSSSNSTDEEMFADPPLDGSRTDLYGDDSSISSSSSSGSSIANDYSSHSHIYYVHYTEWDRRMDDWVTRDRIRGATQIAAILAKQQQQQQQQLVTADDDGSTTAAAAAAAATATALGRSDSMSTLTVTATGVSAEPRLNADGTTATDTDTLDDAAAAAAATALIPAAAAAAHGDTPHTGGHGPFTAEDLLAHEAATKVKNVERIVVGRYHMKTWYFSPMPVEYNRFRTLWFCEYCLSYFGHESELLRHSSLCTLRHPPGNEIYRSRERNVTVSAFEVDGAVERVYCQSLCYIGKLYLDHKTLEYDCTPFLFYVVCEVDEYGYHLVGYFSKEKQSTSVYNLACILTLPCHQRKGYGKFIISLSYELSKVEERVGSPEKPISDLGQQAYSSYWSSTLIQELARLPVGAEISIDELSRYTCITTDDILETLKMLKVLQWYGNRWVISETQVLLLETDRVRREKKLEISLDSDANSMFVSACRPERLHWVAYAQKKPKPPIVYV